MKVIKCRAAVIEKIGEPMKIRTITIDPPKGDQIRVRMVSAGCCASDGHVVWGHMFSSCKVPIVLGHEGAGVIESVGEDITDLKVGDHVLTNIMSQCGDCKLCTNELTNCCETQGFRTMSDVVTKRLDNEQGTDVYNFVGLGVFSEYCLLRKSQIVKIDSNLNLEAACIVSCAVATGFYSAVNQAKVTPDSTVAIWGLGAIGLNAVYGAKYAGAKHIIGIDINSDKRQIAQHYGCTEFINPNELPKDQTIEMYIQSKYNGGLDYAIECIGNQACIDSAFNSLSVYGTLALVGVSMTAHLKYPIMALASGKKIVGGFLGNKRSRESFVELAHMALNGKYDLDGLISHRFKLDEINEAFQLLKEGKCVRSIILF